MEDILVAASRVLTREGEEAFTTLRVAEVAGVSVGSLYQYFPGKEAILFALHQREWEATQARMEALLGRTDLPFPERVRGALLVFFETKREEVALRRALADSDRLFKATEAFRGIEESTKRRCAVLMARALPRARRRDARDVVEIVFRLTVALSATLAEGPVDGEEARRLVALHVDMPSFARAVDGGRPYRAFFPLGAPTATEVAEPGGGSVLKGAHLALSLH